MLSPVCLCQLVCNISKHFFNSGTCLAGGLVDAGHQVVTLLAEGLHVRVRHLDSAFKVQLVSASERWQIRVKTS